VVSLPPRMLNIPFAWSMTRNPLKWNGRPCPGGSPEQRSDAGVGPYESGRAERRNHLLGLGCYDINFGRVDLKVVRIQDRNRGGPGKTYRLVGHDDITVRRGVAC
jgi:hypothetical protein